LPRRRAACSLECSHELKSSRVPVQSNVGIEGNGATSPSNG